MERLKNIRRKGNQMEVRRRADGKYGYFPLDTPIPALEQFRDMQLGTVAHTFGADILRYAETYKHRPSYKHVIGVLGLFAETLGRDRHRNTITDTEIEAMITDWTAADVSAATIRKRRGILHAFFRKVNGPKGHNPVTGTTNPKAPKPEARGLSMDQVRLILEDMFASSKKSRRQSLAKIRARIIAWSGIPPGILRQLGPRDWSPVTRRVKIPPRLKGAGVEARSLELCDEAVAAFQDLQEAGGFGHFGIKAVNRAVQRAARRVAAREGFMLPDGFRLYDLRHSYLSHVYKVTRDLATVSRLALHAENSTVSRRYTMGVHEDVDRAAIAAVNASFSVAQRDAFRVHRGKAAKVGTGANCGKKLWKKNATALKSTG